MELSEFIIELRNLKKSESPIIKVLYDYDGLIKSLEEFEEIIGMNSAKQFIVRQVKSIIYNMRKGKKALAGNMVNLIVLGPPGVGKTTFAMAYSKILRSLGFGRKPTVKNLQTQDREILMKNELTRVDEEIKGVNSMMENMKRYTLSAYMLLTPDQREIDSVKKMFEASYGCLSALDTQLSKVKPITIPPPVIQIPSFSSNTQAQNNPEVKVVSRTDFVDQHIGASGLKTRALLESSRGCVLVIDEAYSLYLDDRDSFGFEALTALTLWMSQNPDDIIFCFVGYKEKLIESILSAQPGLSRRFQRKVEIDTYNADELYRIFLYQLKQKGFKLFENNESIDSSSNKSSHDLSRDTKLSSDKSVKQDLSRDTNLSSNKLSQQECKENIDSKDKIQIKSNKSMSTQQQVKELFTKNISKLTGFGGDTAKMVTDIEEEYTSRYWLKENLDEVIDFVMVERAYESMTNHKILTAEEKGNIFVENGWII